MYCAKAQSDVMCSALLTREAHITCEANITTEGHISFRASGTHRSKNKSTSHEVLLFLEAPPGIEPGIEVLQTFALPLGHSALLIFIKIGHDTRALIGADYGARTRHLRLGKATLYQMS